MMAESTSDLAGRLGRARAPKARLDPTAVYYTPADIARAMGWSTLRVRRWLKRAGILERRHGTLITTPERLHAEFPEVWHRLIGGTLADED
jgi:hypothetical protein